MCCSSADGTSQTTALQPGVATEVALEGEQAAALHALLLVCIQNHSREAAAESSPHTP